MKIGIYGGTFDPVHRGHVGLVKRLMKRLALNKVIVVPAFVSPFKEGKPPMASGHHRLEMAKLAFSGLERVEVSDQELKRSGVSYTIDTIHEILDAYPYADLYLLLTEDAREDFPRWRASFEIERLSEVVFEAREESPLAEISSTKVREKLLRGEDCSEFLPPKVVDYIHEHHLYSSV